jgi:hypothetical protein
MMVGSPVCFLLVSILLSIFFLSESVNANVSPAFLRFRGGTSFVVPKETTTPLVHSAVGIIVARNNATNHPLVDLLPWVAAAGTGGDDDFDNNNNNNNDLSSSCIIMLDDNQSAVSLAPNLPRDDMMTKTMALLCDIVIVVLPDTAAAVYANLVASLVQGAKKRVGASSSSLLGKGRLILVTPAQEEEEEDSLRMDDLVQRQFADIVPSEWETFDIVSKSMLQERIKELLRDARGSVCTIFSDEEEGKNAQLLFVKLLYQVYQQQQLEFNNNNNNNNYSSIPPFDVRPLLVLHDVRVADTEAPSNATAPAASLSTSEKDQPIDAMDQDARMQETVINCQAQLESLELKLQDVLLSDNQKQMPLLEFGALADQLLNETYAELSDYFPSFGERLGVLTPVVTELHRLYKEQLQTLRDYYGKRYEHILEESNDEREWTSAAERFIQGFQAAATNSVPTLCRPNEALAGIAPFLETNPVQGLITDMLEATQLRKDGQSLAMEIDEEEEEEVLGRFRRVPRWLKKLGGRALVLGVNYIQGWLAWQGVRRAASERDRSMPKFPLF